MPEGAKLIRRFRIWMGFFIFGLVVSGITAFPLETELIWLCQFLGISAQANPWGEMGQWLLLVRNGLIDTNYHYPWLAYGTDWLAFGHLMLAVFFLGPLRDPRQSRWILQCGMFCCMAVIPLAMICGAIRSIPLGWRLIDCSFGIFGMIPLLACWRILRKWERT